MSIKEGLEAFKSMYHYHLSYYQITQVNTRIQADLFKQLRAPVFLGLFDLSFPAHW